jgi:hypothetical protein
MITPTYKLHSQVDSFIFNDENDVLVGEWEVVIVVVVTIAVTAAAAVASYPVLSYLDTLFVPILSDHILFLSYLVLSSRVLPYPNLHMLT